MVLPVSSIPDIQGCISQIMLENYITLVPTLERTSTRKENKGPNACTNIKYHETKSSNVPYTFFNVTNLSSFQD